MRDIFAELTNEICEALETGVIPWRRPWNPEICAGPSAPHNAVTGDFYHGANSLVLGMSPLAVTTGDPRWCTYLQATSKGWQVKKGAKSRPVFFWKRLSGNGVEDAGEQEVADQRPGSRFMCKVYAVFHLSQVEGAPPYIPPTAEEAPWQRPEAMQTILTNSGAQLTVGGDRAFYSPMTDHINLPPDHAFADQYAWSAVAAHEMGHWTGAKHRLNRDLEGGFGSARYAMEELRAELSSVFIGAMLGLPHPLEDHSAYIGHWLKKLKEDKREVFRAAADAQKITNYLMDFHPDYSLAHERELLQTLPRPSESQPMVASL